MGLAAPRKRTKISHDPNNTNWSRSTSGFGHKILSSQGWTPGSFLGARNAAHADMFTAASASHIRVVLKDDTMGLGAKSKRDMNEPTGLDAFKGLLGRLNGKSDVELAADQRKCEDVKLARYAASKWHAVQFVSGGLLAQEKPDLPEVLASNEATAQDTPKTSEKNGETLSSTSEEQRSKSERRQEKKEKRERKEKKEKEKGEKKEKKGKKRKHVEGKFPEESDGVETAVSETKTSPSPESASGVSSVTAVKVSRERRPMGRQVFRGRHIEQKKKALLDDKSLNEIFMVKS